MMARKNKSSFSSHNRWIMIPVNLIVALILAAFSVQFVPPIFLKDIQIDLFLFFIAYFVVLQFVVTRFVKRYLGVVYVLLICSIFILSVLGLGWDVPTMFRNAKISFMQLSKRASEQTPVTPASEGTIAPHISLQQRIQQKVNHKSPIVRTFAVKYSLLYFDNYYSKFGQICRQMSLMKYIKENFKYVRDPDNFDYFAPPEESIELMAGDCDDYSILMASVLKAIGANVRIIWSPGHVYPELYCGNKNNFDKYVSAIYIFFEEEIGNKKIHYRLDKNGDYWLNIDYTDKYPGSKYFSEEVLAIIYIK